MRRPPLFLMIPYRLVAAAAVFLFSVCYYPIREGILPVSMLYGLIPAVLLLNMLPYWICIGYFPGKRPKKDARAGRSRRQLAPGLSLPALRACAHGLEILHVFILSAVATILVHVLHAPMLWRGQWREWLASAGIAFLVEAAVFGNGMLSLYLRSTQLGLRRRVFGILGGLVPILQLVVLYRIMVTVRDEIRIECTRRNRNTARAHLAICKTKYPVLLVHGIFFRDYKRFNYWGRIPEELLTNGATIYYGEQPSAVSVRESGGILAERIRTIVRETGCEKVNIIAHSKGGLDIRAALAFENIAPYVASVTTVNTPHRGCLYADYLLNTASEAFRQKVAFTYNGIARMCGDPNPDFLAAVGDLTVAACADFNEQTGGDAAHTEGILCRSVHCRLNRAKNGQFPMNVTYLLAKWFEGANDGLVSDDSATWGEDHLMLTTSAKRGISHLDMTDLTRENIPDFDVREFYVQWVADLKERGL